MNLFRLENREMPGNVAGGIVAAVLGGTLTEPIDSVAAVVGDLALIGSFAPSEDVAASLSAAPNASASPIEGDLWVGTSSSVEPADEPGEFTRPATAPASADRVAVASELFAGVSSTAFGTPGEPFLPGTESAEAGDGSTASPIGATSNPGSGGGADTAPVQSTQPARSAGTDQPGPGAASAGNPSGGSAFLGGGGGQGGSASDGTDEAGLIAAGPGDGGLMSLNPPGGGGIDPHPTFLPRLKSVAFSGTGFQAIEADPGDPTYPLDPPQWLDQNVNGSTADAGDRALPISYVRNNFVTVSARFVVDSSLVPPETPVMVRADGIGSWDVSPTSARWEGSEIVLDPTPVQVRLANAVDYYPSFEIFWDVSADGGQTWASAGSSVNELYVTLATSLTTNYHSVVHIGTTYSIGATTQDQVINGSWIPFDARDVQKRPNPQEPMQDRRLYYYKNWNLLPPEVSTKQLLLKGDGRCNGWTHLFLDVLKVHGIQQSNNYVTVTANPDGLNLNGLDRPFLVIEYWSWVVGGSNPDPALNGQYPYVNYIPPTGATVQQNGVWSYTWAGTPDVVDQAGMAGQNTANPVSIFLDHALAWVTVGAQNYYYDPSYGERYTSLESWELTAVAGFSRATTVNTPTGGKPAYIFKMNPAGSDVNESKSSF